MDVLFLVPYVPNRIRVRPYHLLHGLAASGHRVTLVTAWTTEAERLELEALKARCARVCSVHLPRGRSWGNCLAALPSRVPLQAAYSWHPELARQAEQLAHKTDVIHVEHLRGSAYALWLRDHLARSGGSVPIVWDSVDCISLLFRQSIRHAPWAARNVLLRLELARTRRFEGHLAYAFARTLATSSNDAQELTRLAGGDFKGMPVSVLPNGVDLEYFRPVDESLRQPATVVMTGKMSYHANVAMAAGFVRDVLPAVLARLPDARVLVVGKDPPEAVRALGRHPAVTVAGTVPDVRPYLQQATLAVAPVAYAVGVQNKVLEAMACATPVVAYPQAVSALEVVDGREVVVADGPLAMADSIVELIGDRGRRTAVGLAGRKYVESHHDWSDIITRLERIYHEVIRTGV